MLLQEIRKLDCERCMLSTEHYVEFEDGVLVFCRCLRCGCVEEHPQSVQQRSAFPSADRRPIYVL